jgi:hypothetical protein
MEENELNHDQAITEDAEDDVYLDAQAEDDFSILKVKESYCMACEAPLKSYHSLVCPDCLGFEADKFKELVEELSEHDMPDCPIIGSDHE